MDRTQAHLIWNFDQPPGPIQGRPVPCLQVPLKDGWTASYWIDAQDAGPIVGAVTVYFGGEGDIPPGGLPRNILRDHVHINAAVDLAREKLVEGEAATAIRRTRWIRFLAEREKVGAESFHDPEFDQRCKRMRKYLAAAKARPGRSGHPAIYYARLSYLYLGASQRRTRGVIDELINDLRWEPERIKESLRTARDRHLLSPTPRGRAGGHLLAAGVQALVDAGDLPRRAADKTRRQR